MNLLEVSAGRIRQLLLLGLTGCSLAVFYIQPILFLECCLIIGVSVFGILYIERDLRDDKKKQTDKRDLSER